MRFKTSHKKMRLYGKDFPIYMVSETEGPNETDDPFLLSHTPSDVSCFECPQCGEEIGVTQPFCEDPNSEKNPRDYAHTECLLDENKRGAPYV